MIDGATATIPWLAVCLPSRWAPEDKVGRHFAEVHAPVADNAMLRRRERIARAPRHRQRSLGALRLDDHAPTRACTSTRRAAPRRLAGRGADAEALAAQACFRTEHQTFIPIAGSGQAVFTIHVESEPLADAVHDARRRRAGCTTRSPACRRPCSPTAASTAARDRLLAWLRRARRRAPARA